MRAAVLMLTSDASCLLLAGAFSPDTEGPAEAASAGKGPRAPPAGTNGPPPPRARVRSARAARVRVRRGPWILAETPQCDRRSAHGLHRTSRWPVGLAWLPSRPRPARHPVGERRAAVERELLGRDDVLAVERIDTRRCHTVVRHDGSRSLPALHRCVLRRRAGVERRAH